MSRHPFLDAADATLALLQEPEVAARWDEPSALAEMTVGALAEHLASQVVSGARGLTDAAWAPRGERIELLEHYRRSAWVGADIDTPATGRPTRARRSRCRTGRGRWRPTTSSRRG